MPSKNTPAPVLLPHQFISKIVHDADTGWGFVPLIGSGLSRPSGIITGYEFTDYLAFATYLVLADPTTRSRTHGEGFAARWNLLRQGWPPLPNQQELSDAREWILREFEALCCRLQLEPNYDGSDRRRIKSLTFQGKISPAQGLVSVLMHPIIPIILASEEQVPNDDRTRRFSMLLLKNGGMEIPASFAVDGLVADVSRSHQQHIQEMGIRALHDWRETLQFLACVKVHTHPDRLSFSRIPDQSIIDAFNSTITRDRQPNLGHKMLAHLSGALRFHTILTTNFDTLIEDAFNQLSLKIRVLPVSSHGSLPNARTVAAEDTIVKLHGEAHDTRADLSLDDDPKQDDLEAFSDYLTRGGPYSTVEDQNESRRLLVIGYSGSDYRCLQMIKHWLESATDRPIVYWVCFSQADVRKTQHIFSSEQYQGRIRITQTTRPDLLLYELYQRLQLSLPPGGLSYEFSHILPPRRTPDFQSSDSDVQVVRECVQETGDLLEASRLIMGHQGRIEDVRALAHDAVVATLAENLIKVLTSQSAANEVLLKLTKKLDSRRLPRFLAWTPLYRDPSQFSPPAGFRSPILVESAGGVVRACSIAAETVAREQGVRVMWMETVDYIDVDGLIRDFFRSLAHRFGIFQSRHVSLHPLSKPLLEKTDPKKTEPDWKSLRDQIRTHLQRTLDAYRVDAIQLRVLIYGRDGYGCSAGLIPSPWTDPLQIKGMHCFIESLAAAGIQVVYFPLLESRAELQKKILAGDRANPQKKIRVETAAERKNATLAGAESGPLTEIFDEKGADQKGEITAGAMADQQGGTPGEVESAPETAVPAETVAGKEGGIPAEAAPVQQSGTLAAVESKPESAPPAEAVADHQSEIPSGAMADPQSGTLAGPEKDVRETERTSWLTDEHAAPLVKDDSSHCADTENHKSEAPSDVTNKAATDFALAGSTYLDNLVKVLHPFMRLSYDEKNKLNAKGRESTPTENAEKLFTFLYALSLFRHSRHPNALCSEATFQCPYRFNANGIDNDFVRSEESYRWITELRRGGLFLDKPGGAAWMQRETRVGLQFALEQLQSIRFVYGNKQKETEAEQQQTPEKRPHETKMAIRGHDEAIEIRARLHFWIGDWYLKAFCSSGHHVPILEAVHHHIMACCLAKYAKMKTAKKAKAEDPEFSRIQTYRHFLFMSAIREASKTLLLARSSLKLWQSSPFDVSWMNKNHLNLVEKELIDASKLLNYDSESQEISSTAESDRAASQRSVAINDFIQIISSICDELTYEGGGISQGKDFAAVSLQRSADPEKKSENTSSTSTSGVRQEKQRVIGSPEIRHYEGLLVANIIENVIGSEEQHLLAGIKSIIGANSSDYERRSVGDEQIAELSLKKSLWRENNAMDPAAVGGMITRLGRAAWALMRKAKLNFHANMKISPNPWLACTVLCNLGIDFCKHLPHSHLRFDFDQRVQLHMTYGLALANLGRFFEANRHLNEAQAILSKLEWSQPEDFAAIGLRRAEVKLTECLFVACFLPNIEMNSLHRCHEAQLSKDVNKHINRVEVQGKGILRSEMLQLRIGVSAALNPHGDKRHTGVSMRECETAQRDYQKAFGAGTDRDLTDFIFIPPRVAECLRKGGLEPWQSGEEELPKPAVDNLVRLYIGTLDEAVSLLDQAEKMLRGNSQSALWWLRLYNLRLRIYGMLGPLGESAETCLIRRKFAFDQGIHENFINALRIAGTDELRQLRALRYFSEAYKWYEWFVKRGNASSRAESLLPDSKDLAVNAFRRLKEAVNDRLAGVSDRSTSLVYKGVDKLSTFYGRK